MERINKVHACIYFINQNKNVFLQNERLKQSIRELKKEHRKEKENIVEDFSTQINELEEKVSEKTREVELMQSELKVVKEFRRKRGQMQKELDDVSLRWQCIDLLKEKIPILLFVHTVN